MVRAKIFLIIILFSGSNLYSQLEISVYTDKISYEYGEKIEFKCKITNPADTTFQFFAGTHSSCQAEFSFNNFNSWEHTACLATTELLIFEPYASKIYTWLIDPMVSGLPNNEGSQQIIGTYYFDLVDTIYIEAPQFLGGQLNVGYSKEYTDSIQQIKDSLGIDVINQSDYGDRFSELWQVVGHQIDSLINRYDEDIIFNYVEKAIIIEYESMKFENTIDSIVVKTSNDTIFVWDYNAWEQCAFQLDYTVETIDSIIKITQIDTASDMTTCYGYHNIIIPVVGLTEGNYRVDIYRDCLYEDVKFIGSIRFNYIIDYIKKLDNKPNQFTLFNAYPNPFNPSTKIKYSIPVGVALNATTAIVTLKIYDILGREVSELVNKEQSSGEYEIIFDASNLGSGIYFYQLRAGSFAKSRNMILLK